VGCCASACAPISCTGACRAPPSFATGSAAMSPGPSSPAASRKKGTEGIKRARLIPSVPFFLLSRLPPVLLGGVLRDGLLRGGLGRRLGGGLLHHRRRNRTGGLGHGARTGVAVAGVVTLALGSLAVALAHVVLLDKARILA